MTSPFESYDVLGVPVSVVNLASASARLVHLARARQAGFVTCPDVSNVVRAQDDPQLLAAHRSAQMVCPDGMPLVWIGKRRGYPVGRACGPDLMLRVANDGEGAGLRHYLYGGKEGIAQVLERRLSEMVPGIVVVGMETPPFRPLTAIEVDELAERINAADVDVVWVGLSTPKQELLMIELSPKTKAVLVGVGAAFDFHSGAVARAPVWMQRAGVEWLFRLSQEPARLWRRYVIMAPMFLWLLATRRTV